MADNRNNSTENIWNSWYDSAKVFAIKAQEMAESAGKVAAEKATELAKKAEDMSKNYDFEKATSILMGTVGGPIDPNSYSTDNMNRKKKSLKQALEEMDMTYITENLVSMAFPYDFDIPRNYNKIGNDIDVVAALLRKRHAGHFMIWNVSEEQYNYAKFGDQVLEYKFPGHPAPPLGLLFKICTSVESWLDADERNIAVVHCLTGKGRTAALLACILAWMGEFSSPMEALQYVSDRRKISVDYLTIPSQRRYIQYFSNMLDGVKPRSEPLLLRRIIINSVPIFGTEVEGDESTQGCCPYLQLFKNGRLIATAAPLNESHHDGHTSSVPAGSSQQLRWIKASEGSASFTLDTPIQGDILLRCRHAAKSGARVSMFRCGFHTGYVPSGVLRLTKAQLDGSSSDNRYDDEFFIDLIFAPILTASNISKDSINSSSSVPQPTGTSDQGLTIDATSTDKYEQSLHKDTKFWESISTRKQRAKRRKSRKFLSNQQEQFSIVDDGVKLFENDDNNDISLLTSKYTSSSISADISKGSDKGGSGNNLSDMELIMQLAQAEDDEASAANSDGAESGCPMSGSHMSSGVLTGGTISEQGNDSDDYALVGKGERNDPRSHSLSDSTSSPDSKPPTTTGIASAGAEISKQPQSKNELQALEDLERELGLDIFSGGSATTAPSTTTATTDKSAEKSGANSGGLGDDLDELEKYLQSFATK